MPKAKKSKLPLFDIRVHSVDKDTILLKGAASDANPTLLSGTIAVSVTEPFHVKKMKLKLYATLSFNWDEKFYNSRGQVFTKPFKFNKMVYCFDWDPINLEKFLNTHAPLQSQFLARSDSQNSIENIKNGVGFTTGTLTRSNHGSTNNLQRLGSTTTLNSIGSSASIPGLTTANNSHSRSLNNLSSMNLTSLTSSEPIILQPGNYEFPFQAILDGSIPESIIDHPCCSLVYRLQCIIERGRFSTPIITRKLLHVIRTLSPDNPELSETVAVDNNWPDKIDYSISVPTKAIAIGSSCQIFISMTPLSKGLKLGAIKIKLVEHSIFSTIAGQHNDERTLTTKHIPKVTTNSQGVDIWSDSLPLDQDGVFYRNHNLVLSQDRWEVTTSIQLPPSLEIMSQDLDIVNLCKIRHKLKFSVSLLNTDGHISELRATLPVTLFISPFIPVKIKTIDAYEDPFKSSTYEDVTIHSNNEKIIFQNEDINATVLHSLHNIQPHHNNVNEVPDIEGIVPTANINSQNLMAPPNYNDRVYDRVYDDYTNIEMNANQTANGNIAFNVNLEDDDDEDQSLPTQTRSVEQSNITSSEIEQHNQFNQSVNFDSTTNIDDLNSFTETSLNKKVSRKYKKPIFSIQSDEEDDAEDDESSTLNPFEANLSLPTKESTIPMVSTNVISGPAFNSGERMTISHMPSSGYLMSPGTLSPVQHLSRATSFIGDPFPGLGLSSSMPSLNHVGNAIIDNQTLKKMNKPPSYDIAIHSVASMKDLTPVYDNAETEFRSSLHILDSRLHNLRLSRLDEHQTQQHSQQPSLRSSSTISSSQHSKSTSSLNHFNSTTKRHSQGHSAAINHSTSQISMPSLPRNVSSTSLMSNRRYDSHNNNVHTSSSNSASKFEIRSPNNKSLPDTARLRCEGSPFPTYEDNSNQQGVLCSPKAAHIVDHKRISNTPHEDTSSNSSIPALVSRKSTGLFGSLRSHK